MDQFYTWFKLAYAKYKNNRLLETAIDKNYSLLISEESCRLLTSLALYLACLIKESKEDYIFANFSSNIAKV